MKIILVLAVLYVIYTTFTVNLLLGIGATIAFILYGYFKWYPKFCILHAKKVYRKDPELALKWFDRAAKRRLNIGQMETYAFYLLREGRVEKAEEIYKKILAAPIRPELRLKIRSEYAVLLSKTGRIDEAIEELEEVTVHYTNTVTYGSLGYLYILKDSIRKATNYNLEAYDYNSDDPVILDNLTQLYIKLGDINKAKKYADEMIEKQPYFAEAYYDSAYVYMKLGDMMRAKELIEDARCCRLSFMSTVTEEDINKLSDAIESGKANEFMHKLGKFSGNEEIEEENPEDLPQIEEETSEEFEYEDDPFI